MTAETLHCRCGVEVRIVRLNRQTLVLGHVTNPRNNRHPVRLARDDAETTATREEAAWRHREGPGQRAGARGPLLNRDPELPLGS